MFSSPIPDSQLVMVACSSSPREGLRKKVQVVKVGSAKKKIENGNGGSVHNHLGAKYKAHYSLLVN